MFVVWLRSKNVIITGTHKSMYSSRHDCDHSLNRIYWFQIYYNFKSNILFSGLTSYVVKSIGYAALGREIVTRWIGIVDRS